MATSLLSYFLIGIKFEESKTIDWKKISILAVTTCLSIWFQNLSLQLNSVGFYQVFDIPFFSFPFNSMQPFFLI